MPGMGKDNSSGTWNGFRVTDGKVGDMYGWRSSADRADGAFLQTDGNNPLLRCTINLDRVFEDKIPIII